MTGVKYPSENGPRYRLKSPPTKMRRSSKFRPYPSACSQARRAGMTGPAPIFEGQMGFEKELGVSLGNVGEIFEKKKEAMKDEGAV